MGDRRRRRRLARARPRPASGPQRHPGGEPSWSTSWPGRADWWRAWTDVGGQPRALEYLDALVRGGEARFADVAEELGNRSGMANSYHQLGMIAEERGSYDEALEWYRKSLRIKEELGKRSGMASTLSQIGILLTERGEPQEGVALNLRSLAIRQEIGSPEVRIDIHWLNRQRELLGAERFATVLAEHLDAEGVASVLALLQEDAGEEG